jgi:hypothetical protein
MRARRRMILQRGQTEAPFECGDITVFEIHQNMPTERA